MCRIGRGCWKTGGDFQKLPGQKSRLLSFLPSFTTPGGLTRGLTTAKAAGVLSLPGNCAASFTRSMIKPLTLQFLLGTDVTDSSKVDSEYPESTFWHLWEKSGYTSDIRVISVFRFAEPVPTDLKTSLPARSLSGLGLKERVPLRRG